jgi:hypothetical protein
VTPEEHSAKDVILAVASYADHDADSRRPLERFDTSIRVHGDVWIGELDHDFAEAILDACSPRGENHEPYRQYGASYALYKDFPASTRHYKPNFDPDLELRLVLFLSRLVHPTSMGLERSVRVRWWSNGKREIIAYNSWDQNRNAFVVHPNEDWLLPSDMSALSALLTAYHANKPPPRVARALWFYEAAFRQYYVDLRWAFLVMALEALVHIRKEKLPSGKRFVGTTKVFVDRLLHLGTLDSALTIPEQTLFDFYEERSVVAHGQVFGRLGARLSSLYDELEEFARRILRKAVLDPGFAGVFITDAQIKAALPLRP